ncbi:uncharacterized protein LOC123714563 [Pieris brassicae]|uniref:uncharacterized protein LOC123714563 n=1 Tax=Pieris brassicae TaxID=7116 RepID=UPI001E65EC46|nr:uncharacterized protein LOC123714563 [Pieris brassicae]
MNYIRLRKHENICILILGSTMDTRICLLFSVLIIANVNAFVKRDVVAETEEAEEASNAETSYGIIERVKYCYGETLSNTVNIVKKEHLQPLLSFFEHSWNKIRRYESEGPKYERYSKDKTPITWDIFQHDIKEFRNCVRQTLTEIVDDVTETKLQPLFHNVEEQLGKLTRVVDVLTTTRERKPQDQE